jgi:hypothetical protein
MIEVDDDDARFWGMKLIVASDLREMYFEILMIIRGCSGRGDAIHRDIQTCARATALSRSLYNSWSKQAEFLMDQAAGFVFVFVPVKCTFHVFDICLIWNLR